MPDLPDIESQLRRYADQVEGQVDAVPTPSRSSGRPTSSRRAWLGAAAAVVLVAVGVVIWSLGGEDESLDPIAEPDVIVGDEDGGDPPPDTTPEADPPPAGDVVVPDLVGLDLDEAQLRLAELGLVFEVAFESRDDVPENSVYAQEPVGGASLDAGAIVLLRISSGLETAEIPIVSDLFADTAIKTLREAGFEVATVFELVAEGSPTVGRVLRQSPGPLIEAPVGTLVTITVGEPAWQPISDLSATRIVDGFLAALARREWSIAARYMNNGASEPRSLIEIGLEEGGGDWETILEDWCAQALCGADYTVGPLIRTDLRTELEVTFSSAAGPVRALFSLSWFEGETTVDALPPAGIVGEPWRPAHERLFNDTADAIVSVYPFHTERSDGGLTAVEAGLDRSRIVGFVDDTMVFDGEPIRSYAPPYEYFGFTDLIDGRLLGVGDLGTPVAFVADEVGAVVAVPVGGPEAEVGPPVHQPLEVERLPYRYSVSESLIAVSTVAGESCRINLFEPASPGTYATGSAAAQIEPDGRCASDGVVAPNGQSLVALATPDVFSGYSSVMRLGLDGSVLGEWGWPGDEQPIASGLGFDGRWIILALASGRVFVVDTAADAARVVDVYAQVFFD